MERSDYLRVRGWTPIDDGWCNRRGRLSRKHTEDEAIAEQQARDDHHVKAFGSVLYWPTAEQAQTSPLCAALAASHMTEASAIERLFRESEERFRCAVRLSELQPPAPIMLSKSEATTVLLAKLKREEAIAEAWKASALAERRDAAAARFGTDAEKNRAFAQAQEARDALQALGVNPDGHPPAAASQ